MKKLLLLAGFAAILSFPTTLSAQDNDDDEDKVNENEEIIIRKKEDAKNEKVTIEVKDGKVTVNGKPVEEYEGNGLEIRKRKQRENSVIIRKSPFRNEDFSPEMDHNFNFDFNPGKGAFLGVSTEESDGGAKITAVTENSAAAKAGLKKGDIIKKVDDAKIENHGDLVEAISRYEPDEKVTITYNRDGKESKQTLNLGEKKQRSMSFAQPRIQGVPEIREFHLDRDGDNFGPNFLFNARPRIGLRAQDTEDGKGVKVLDVDGDSPADKAGIKENDIITEFDGKAVNSADELARLAREGKEKNSFNVKLNRGGKSQNVEIKIPKRLKTANL
jgi:serine protease Do